ncbi:hypothetical protein DL766_001020 [Monosporascus sp. MC13-8B]|uniref:Enoyl reductase (ER) domain-containing protein n=1 Tax=Monosporascus cannonballus TaxID=155416 RepID=A0ABY0H6Q0_9PEZI|nr:hypothetical protein DL763_010664 [Monosporascus cannonballus]RYO86363.1 hypothetical protein DL762_004779 [Monosporascus cannonballus]RYP38311.1 hypothetical protein DL766_001020 [Monosporascus sp. MC13-8B]
MATSTHKALVIVAPRQPYEIHKYPTIAPQADEVLVKVLFTSSTPLDLHQADGGLLVEPPFRTGSSCAGLVVEVGPEVKHLQPGDKVFGFERQVAKEKPHQELHAPRAHDNILIWGASSSVGQYAIQILKFYGYRNLIATASPANHQRLRELGASEVYDYRSPTIVDDLLEPRRKDGASLAFPMIVDCIGSVPGSLRHISRVAQSGSTVAVMLPVILKHATREEAPEYGMDVSTSVEWAEGVTPRGVRTHFFWRNEFFVEKLQSVIMPEMLARGIVKPNKYRLVEGRDLLERATKALDLLRDGVSAEKLVWRVSEE